MSALRDSTKSKPSYSLSREYRLTEILYLLSGIDVLEAFLGEAHKAIKDEAGWVGLTITGGPNPRMGGGLSYKM
jgi:hypothetical protein